MYLKKLSGILNGVCEPRAPPPFFKKWSGNSFMIDIGFRTKVINSFKNIFSVLCYFKDFQGDFLGLLLKPSRKFECMRSAGPVDLKKAISQYENQIDVLPTLHHYAIFEIKELGRNRYLKIIINARLNALKRP